MNERVWSSLLRRYGQEVTVERDGQRVKAWAFLQEREVDEQFVPSPLGVRREETAEYFGSREVPLVPGESRVEWKGRCYEVRAVREVGGHHIRAALRRREEDA